MPRVWSKVRAVGGGKEWHPGKLFGPGDKGGFWDFRPPFVFQDSAGTIPAKEGDPVGFVTDSSGNGLHLTQATTAAKPTLQQDAGGRYCLVFDAVEDNFTCHTTARTMCAVRQVTFVHNNYTIDGRPDTADSYIWKPYLAFGDAWTERYVNGQVATPPYPPENIYVVTAALAAPHTGTWTLFNRYTLNEGLGGRAWAILLIDRSLTTAERRRLERWMARRAGMTLP